MFHRAQSFHSSQKDLAQAPPERLQELHFLYGSQTASTRSLYRTFSPAARQASAPPLTTSSSPLHAPSPHEKVLPPAPLQRYQSPASADETGLMASLLASPRAGYTPLSAISPPLWHAFISNFRTLFHLAWPVVLSYLLQFSLSLINLMFIGHIGSDKLAAAALGRTAHSTAQQRQRASHIAHSLSDLFSAVPISSLCSTA